MALRLGGGQQAMTAANTLGSNLVRDAQLQRLGALAQSGEMAGTIRGQDVDVSAQSADIMNRFNEWASQLSTMAARDNAQARQTAQGQNAANKQRVSEWNAINKQATQESNLERQNHLKELTFSNDLSRRGALVNAMNTLGGAKNAGSAATAANIRALGTGLGNIAGTGIGALGLL